jgi:FkbM family methyltransferase
VVERGVVGATGNLYCGLHEFNDMALVLHYFSGGGGLFLDVGANVGSYTILAAKVAGAQAITVEPVPATFDRLIRNIVVNGIQDQVVAHRMAIGELPGTLKFSSDRDATNQVVEPSYEGECIDVIVQPLDAVLNARTAQVWKIDVEGFERQVLAGASRSLADPGVEILLLECDDEDIRETMHKHGFQELSYDPFHRIFVPYDGGMYYGNHVWVRNQEEAGKRCRAAPKFSVLGVEF